MTKRLLMPMLVLGIFLTMSGMASAQALTTVTCYLTNSATGTVPGSAPAIGTGTVGGIALQGASGHASSTGHTEVISAGGSDIPTVAGGGNIRVVCYNTGAAATPGVEVLTVSVGAPITNTQSFPSAAAGIRVTNGTGAFVAAGNAAPGTSTAGANVGISSVSNSGGQVIIGLGTSAAGGSTSSGASSPPSGAVNPVTGVTFPGGTVAAPSVSTFDLQGILVSTNGKSGELDTSMTSTGGVNVGASIPNGVAGLPVVTAVIPSLLDPTVPGGTLPSAVAAAFPGVGGGAAILTNSGVAVKGSFTVKITENGTDMFKESAQFNGGGTFPASPASDTEVGLVFKNVPAGLNISGCGAILTDLTGTIVNGGLPTVSSANVTAAAPILIVNFNGAIDQTVSDVLWVTCTTVGVGTAALPLPSTAVTVQVEMFPLGAALSSLSAALTGLATGQVPRFQDVLQPTTAIPIVIFPPAQTTLLIPFGFVGSGYQTGIAIANTSTDPFTPAGGGAAPIDGTVTFTMYKNDGTSKVYTTTAGSPGLGLSSAGVLKSGYTYVVNLSEIMTAAAFGTTFSGYVFVSANFTDAHGAATIYTSTGAAALSSPVLVLPAISTAAVRFSPEILGQ